MSGQHDSSNDKPKSIVSTIGSWEKPPGVPPSEMQYQVECPKGHEKVIGNRPPTPGESIRCDECDTDYEWKR